jgi:hypothetical protein
MTPTDIVQPDAVADSPESYEQFEARIETEEAASAAIPEDTDDPEIAEEPEPTGSAPATSEEEIPSAEPVREPEPAPASEPAKPTQEQKAPATEEESKGGIPQSRLDEITRLRRIAEDERDQLKRELAELKAKPAQAKPEAQKVEVKVEIDEVALKAKVEAELPQVPDLPAEPDPANAEKYPAGEFDRQYQKDLARYEAKAERREELIADRAKEVTRRVEAQKVEAQTNAQTAAQSKSAEESEKAEATERFNGSIAAAKGVHTDFDKVVNDQQYRGHVFPGAVVFGVQMSENPGELIYHLCQNPEVLANLETLASLPDKPTFLQRQHAQRKVDIAISRIEASLSGVPKPVPVPVPPPKPKAPENLKPSVTRAPPPPDNVRPSAGAHAPPVPSNFNEWDEDQARREQVRRRR